MKLFGVFRSLLPVIAAVIAAVSCGRGQLAAGTNVSYSPEAVMTLSDSVLAGPAGDTVDLGRLKEGEVVERSMQLYNAGTKPFAVLRVETSCGCTKAEYPREPLKPGEYGGFSFSFDSRGFGGWVYKTVSVYTSLSSRPYVLVVTAEIERELLNSGGKSW